jgi:hypothetical protein
VRLTEPASWRHRAYSFPEAVTGQAIYTLEKATQRSKGPSDLVCVLTVITLDACCSSSKDVLCVCSHSHLTGCLLRIQQRRVAGERGTHVTGKQ